VFRTASYAVACWFDSTSAQYREDEMKIRKWVKYYKKVLPVGEGWRPLVMKLCKDIIAIDDTVEVAQVKEKFGGLRFYIYGGGDKVYDLIHKAENKSFKICEECGTKNNVSTKGGWLLTLCDKCRAKRR